MSNTAVKPTADGNDRPDLEAPARDQLGLKSMTRTMIKDYKIPIETNSLWYALGGVLGISLVLELVTGMVLALRYIPDAAKAYDVTKSMLGEGGWSVLLNFHYYNAYLIFGLLFVHMMRVFVTAGYRNGRKGLWFVGVLLSGVVFLMSITGETLHWDERGFAVPWHMSEILEAIGLSDRLQYTHADLKNVTRATEILQPYYVAHIVILPMILILLVAWHVYLIRAKKISIPFWKKESGQVVSFASHVREWVVWGSVATVVMIGISLFHRDPGPAPQLLPSSPYYGSKHGPGTLGIVPTVPISWTHGMNRFINIAFNFEPDIWGTVVGLGLMALALLLVPYLDRGRGNLQSTRETFDMSKRGWAFVAVAIFWVVWLVGTITNIITPIG